METSTPAITIGDVDDIIAESPLEEYDDANVDATSSDTGGGDIPTPSRISTSLEQPRRTRQGTLGSRLNAKRVFLTYSQSNELLLEDLQRELITRFDPVICVTSRELHLDGGIHHHGYMEFSKKKNFCGSLGFDVDVYVWEQECERGS